MANVLCHWWESSWSACTKTAAWNMFDGRKLLGKLCDKHKVEGEGRWTQFVFKRIKYRRVKRLGLGSATGGGG